MSALEQLRADFDIEMGRNLKVLERVPADKLDWRPHAKSMTLGRLATHIAEMPGWGSAILTQDEFNFAAKEYKPTQAATPDELLAIYRASAHAAKKALSEVAPDDLTKTWTLRAGDHVIFSRPKQDVFRDMVLNHTGHHRGQLTVYLRLLDVPVPSLFGPSADEQPNFG